MILKRIMKDRKTLKKSIFTSTDYESLYFLQKLKDNS